MIELLVLALYRVLFGLRNGALFVFLPLFIFRLGGSMTQVNLGFSIPAALALLGLPFWGWLSDHRGQRTMTFLSESVAFVCFYGLTAVRQPWVAVLLAGIGGGALLMGRPIAQVGLGKNQRKGQLLGALRTIGDVGELVGTGLGTLAVSSGYITLMAGLAAASLFGCILSWFLPEVKFNKTAFRPSLKKLLKLPILGALLWVGAGSMVEALWNPYTLKFASDVKVGMLATAIAVVFAGANVSGGYLLDKWRTLTAKLHAVLDGVLLLLLPFTSSFLQVSLLRFTSVMPHAVQGVFAEKLPLEIEQKNWGLLSGSLAAMVLLSKVVFPIIGGVLTDTFGYGAAFFTAAVLAFVAAFFIA